jgi:nucleotide-binding universal stress UspA family protein
MVRKVVITIDWSDFAEKAFDYYIYNLHRKENEVILVHFIEASGEEEYLRKEQQMLELQEVYEGRLLQLKIPHIWLTGTGAKGQRPGEFIVKSAKENGASMIIMGARGMGKLKKAILGSVSDYVLSKAGMPVMICKWDKDNLFRTENVPASSGKVHSQEN